MTWVDWAIILICVFAMGLIAGIGIASFYYQRQGHTYHKPPSRWDR